MIYLDNAATSFPKPQEVLSAVSKYIRRYCGNPGRSSHRLASRAAEEVYLARERVSSLLGIDSPERVVFTQNATHALNLAIKTTVCERCHVLVSDVEHNSVIRPIEKLRRLLGVEYSLFSLEGDLYKNLASSLKKNTHAVICTLASNVTGKRADISSLSRFCKERGLKLILDASQLIGHEEINLSKTPCSILCAPGHKALFGLQGSGFAVFSDGECGDSFMEGGSGADSRSTDMPLLLPERYEAGTLATPSIVALSYGVKYVTERGFRDIERHLSFLTDTAANALGDMRGIEVLAAENGILLFNKYGTASTVLAEMLDREGICVRAGLHCAPAAHRILGTLESGAVRASFSALNTADDVRKFTDAVYRITR